MSKLRLNPVWHIGCFIAIPYGNSGRQRVNGTSGHAANCTKSLDTQIEAVDTEIGLILEQDNII